MIDYFSFALIGFLVMVAFPLAFWGALSVAIIKQSRAYVAVTECLGLAGTALAVLAVWNTIQLGMVA